MGTCLAAGSYLWLSWKWIWAKKEREERPEFQILWVEAEGSRKPVLLRGSASGHASPLLALVAGSGGIQPSTPVSREGPPRRPGPHSTEEIAPSDRKPHALCQVPLSGSQQGLDLIWGFPRLSLAS